MGIAIAGSYDGAKIDVPLHVLHGEKDELFDPNDAAKSIQESIQKGSRIDFQTIPDKSHFMACQYANDLRAMAIKVKSQLY